jgi:hypothetical protein
VAMRQFTTQELSNKVPSNHRCNLDFVTFIGSVTDTLIEGDYCDCGSIGRDVCSCRLVITCV